MRVSFLTVDSTGEHDTGVPTEWANRITLKHRIYDSGDEKRMELRAVPDGTIYYTTNGANPKVAGAVYNGDFVIPRDAPMVLAYAQRDGIESDVEQYAIQWDKQKPVDVEPEKPATWTRTHAHYTTKDSYEFLNRLKKYNAAATGLRVTITGEGVDKGWIELNTSEQQQVAPDLIEACLEALRKVQTSGQVQLEAQSLRFDTGLDLQAWVEDAKLTLNSGEVKQ